jgi:predicted ATPase
VRRGGADEVHVQVRLGQCDQFIHIRHPHIVLDNRFIRKIQPYAGGAIDTQRWPATVPAVSQILNGGFHVSAGLTVLVGENGAGKSTVVELIAEASGLNPQGGSRGSRYQTRSSEPGIGSHLTVERGFAGRSAWSYFIRADTMHGLYTYLEEHPGKRLERFHELSHGEGFLDLLRTRVNQPGFYLMDEPDSPLSFVSCLALAAVLHDLAEAGGQAVVATHSPILAAVPGATILEIGDWGIRPATWDDLALVVEWRDFLREPEVYFRYLLEE